MRRIGACAPEITEHRAATTATSGTATLHLRTTSVYSPGVFPRVDGLRSIEFGLPGSSRERLVDLVLHGDKRATAGLLSEYERAGEPLEHEGELLAMVDNQGCHVGTLEVTRVEVLRFADVPDEFALAEAEGDLDAADFRASHLAFWTAVGEHVTDDTPVVTIYFDLLPEIMQTSDH